MRDEEQRQLLIPRSEQRNRGLRRRLAERVLADDRHRAVRSVVGERRAQCRVARLLVHLHVERAHRRRERDAAARELRRADRPGARAAGALLAPRLGAAARDEPARLRPAGSGAVGVQLRANRLVHEMRLDLCTEDGLLEVEVLRLVARRVEQRSTNGHCAPSPP
jgi:hypothetical protein